MKVPRAGRLSGFAVSLCLLLFVFGAGLGPAAAQLLGPEFPANTYVTSEQQHVEVALECLCSHTLTPYAS